MWTCQQCQEEVEDPFDVCWQCGADRGGAVDKHFVRDDFYIDAAIEAGESPLFPVAVTPPIRITNYNRGLGGLFIWLIAASFALAMAVCCGALREEVNDFWFLCGASVLGLLFSLGGFARAAIVSPLVIEIGERFSVRRLIGWKEHELSEIETLVFNSEASEAPIIGPIHVRYDHRRAASFELSTGRCYCVNVDEETERRLRELTAASKRQAP